MNDKSVYRIQSIQKNRLFQELYIKLQDAEKSRIFCKHTMEHFLDVARLMYIFCLEDGESIRKDVIYATALLHDLGRYEQIISGTPHNVAGAEIAGNILRECDFTEDEIRSVQNAIACHREPSSGDADKLTVYLYHADKMSRSCFSCAARAECNWPDEKKNEWLVF